MDTNGLSAPERAKSPHVVRSCGLPLCPSEAQLIDPEALPMKPERRTGLAARSWRRPSTFLVIGSSGTDWGALRHRYC